MINNEFFSNTPLDKLGEEVGVFASLTLDSSSDSNNKNWLLASSKLARENSDILFKSNPTLSGAWVMVAETMEKLSVDLNNRLADLERDITFFIDNSKRNQSTYQKILNDISIASNQLLDTLGLNDYDGDGK